SPPMSAPTPVTSAYAVPPMKATSTTPPPINSSPGKRGGSPLAKSVRAPVVGSTRQMLPVSGAVTNNAPPGPTALPWSSSRPVTTTWAGAATCPCAALRFSEAGSVAGPVGDGGSLHAARAQTNADGKAMRGRIVDDVRDEVGGGDVGGGRPSPRGGAAPRLGRPPLGVRKWRGKS